ncbi:hypothetical protein Acsp03_59780 [Actinomadura sp. NBRC 104412]|nr:hypothetical protein Acsp03_59780 [Actinomadura sp. NBRC 104412]
MPGARFCGTWIYRARDAEMRGGDAGIQKMQGLQGYEDARVRDRSMCERCAAACERRQVWV